eukprot:TRINITY_DN753_c0_g1_i4.p1 TRINITY_DN753_c0_g1~~TRINITY_DN753_c0_g1_i4.p1  ORF type:complete len:2202 (-),score=595.11 TRINITY_DN753_c0_g1_i4:69-6674(-)
MAELTLTPQMMACAGELLKSRFAFKGTNPNELSFKKGAVIKLLGKDESGWAQGEVEGQKGWFPIEFAAPYDPSAPQKPKKKKHDPTKKAHHHHKKDDASAEGDISEKQSSDAAASPATPRKDGEDDADKSDDEEEVKEEQQSKTSTKKEENLQKPAPQEKPAPPEKPQTPCEPAEPAKPQPSEKPLTATPPSPATMRPAKPAVPEKPAAARVGTVRPNTSSSALLTHQHHKSSGGSSASPTTASASPAVSSPLPESVVPITYKSNAEILKAPEATTGGSGVFPYLLRPEDEQKIVAALTGDNSGDGGAAPGAQIVSVVRDYMSQMELLLVKIKADQEGYAPSFDGASGVTQAQIQRCREMPVQVAAHVLVTLRNIIVMHAAFGDQLATTLDILMKMADKFKPPISNTKRPSSKSLAAEEEALGPPQPLQLSADVITLPADEAEKAEKLEKQLEKLEKGEKGEKGEKVAAVATPQTEHPFLFLLRTMKLALASCLQTRCATSDEIGRLPQKVREFFFDQLVYTNSLAIRREAGECLGIVSVHQLEPIVKMFTLRLLACKSDDSFREYVSYHNASVNLKFGFSRIQQVEATNYFFSAIATTSEKKIARAVLRCCICNTLSVILPSILNRNLAPVRAHEFEEKDSKQAQMFRNCYQRIFDNVCKWVKSEKTRLAALNLMSTMLLNDLEDKQTLLFDKCEVFLGAFFNSIKEAKNKVPYLELLRSFVMKQFEPLIIPSSGVTFFRDECESIVSRLLLSKQDLKGKVLPPQDVQLHGEILLSIGRKVPCHIADLKHLKAILQGSMLLVEWPLETKGAIFRTLAQLHKECPDNLTENFEKLLETLQPYFDELTNDTTPLRYILFCFPDLCKPDTRDKVLTTVCRFLADGMTETNQIAHTAVMTYLYQDLSKLSLILTLLLKAMHPAAFKGTEEILRHIKPLCSILDLWQQKVTETGGEPPQLDKWPELRTQLESLCLLLALSNEPVVWTKATVLAELLHKPAFRKLGGDVDGVRDLNTFLNNGVDVSAAGWGTNNNQFFKTRGGLEEEFGAPVEHLWETLRSDMGWFDCPVMVPHWKNFLRFMLTTLRFSFGEMKINDNLLQREQQFLKQIMENYFAGSADLQYTIIEILADAHFSCAEGLCKSLEAEKERQHYDQSKKKNKEALYHQEAVINLFTKILHITTYDFYSSSPGVRQSSRPMISFWVEFPTGLENHHFSLKSQVAICFDKFISLEAMLNKANGEGPSTSVVAAQAAGGASQSPILLPDFACTVFTDCKRLLCSQHTAAAKSSTFEKAIIHIVGLLIQHCPISTDFLTTPILQMLMSSLEYGPHVQEDVASAMTFLLQREPSLFLKFMENSLKFDELPTACVSEKEKDKDKAALPAPVTLSGAMFSLVHLEALVKNFTEHLTDWLDKCSLAKMVCLSIFHQATSPHKEGQQLAMQLSNSLAVAAIPDQPSYEFSFRLPCFSNCALTSVQLALRYSTDLSGRVKNETPNIFSEFDHFIACFDTRRRSVLLTMLPTWAKNFTDVATFDDKSKILEHLFSISCKCNNPDLFSFVQPLWQSLLVTSKPQEVVDFVVTFLTVKCTAQIADAEVLRNCSSFLLYLSRTESAKLVVDKVVEQLRSYTPSPRRPLDFVSLYAIERRGVRDAPAERKLQQQASFMFLPGLMFEHYQLFLPHLPLILQNAFDLYCPTRTRLAESEVVIRNSVLTALMNVESTPRQCDLAAKLAAKQIRFEPATVLKVADILATPSNPFRENWADVALEWGVQHADTEAAVDALKLFDVLSISFNLEMVRRLCLGVLKTVMYNQTEQRNALLAHIQAISNTQFPEGEKSECEVSSEQWEAWQMLCVLAGCLYCTAHIDAFRLAVDLHKKLFGIPEAYAVKLTKTLDRIWSPLESVCVVVRAIAQSETRQSAMWLAESLITNSVRARTYTPPCLMLMTWVMAQGVMCLMRDALGATATKNAIAFVDLLSDCDELQQLREAFTALDFQDVPVSRQRPSAALLRDCFAPALARVFPSRTQFDFALDCTLVWLFRAPRKWRPLLLELLNSVHAAWPDHKLSPEQKRRVVNTAVYYSLAPEAEVSNAAIHSFPYVLRNIPQGVSVKLFDFLRMPTSEFFKQMPNVYQGDDETAVLENTLCCCHKFARFGLGLESEAALFDEITASALAECSARPRAEPVPADKPQAAPTEATTPSPRGHKKGSSKQ